MMEDFLSYGSNVVYSYRIRYRIYDIAYDIVYIVYDIVCQMYDIVCLTYDIVYDICKNYDIVCVLVRFLANRIYDIVYDIVYDILVFADIVYDMQMECRYYTISYAYVVCYVGIIRYRTPISTKTYANTIRCRT